MKEAAGEANMTIITIVLIGVVAVVGAILIPRTLNGSEKKAACAEMGGNLSGTTCTYKEFSSNPDGEIKTCKVSKCKAGSKNEGNWVCSGLTSGIKNACDK